MKHGDGVGWFDDPAHFRRQSRRDFLHVGFIGGIGLTLGQFLTLKARGEAKMRELNANPTATAIIQIFLPGGISAHESFDPKPYAPLEYRGPCGTIPTKLPGIVFSEHLKETAQIADKLTIVRSMSHGEAAHERGTHNMFTGYRPSAALQYPSMGSVISHELGPRKSLPPYVCIPNQPNPYAGSGYLSSAFGPFSVGSDPNAKDFVVRDLNLPDGVSTNRFEDRKNLLKVVDRHFKSMEQSDAVASMDSFHQRAYDLISSQAAREAFDLKAEPDAIRDEYGRTEAGQRMLLARRLVEAGVRFVSLTAGGWDHHERISDGISTNLPPLERRGMLDKTLVMLTTEFGRTPKINKDAGRDHWPRVFSIALAGGGIKRGQVYGSSSATGAEPEDNRLTVEDLATTIYNQIGIPADKELMAPGDRPIEIVKGGEIVKELLA